MKNKLKAVQEFHEAFGLGIEHKPIAKLDDAKLKLRFDFSDIPCVNSKLPCVSPPPCTVCNPTILSKGVPAPEAAVLGMNVLAIIEL